MQSNLRWRPLKHYLLGLFVGGVGAWAFWAFYPGFWKVPADAAVTAALREREVLAAQARALQRVEQERQGPALPASACAYDPLVPAAGVADGKVRAEHPFPADARSKAKVFVGIARRASESGRPRDAEVALIAACRYSEQASGRASVPLARVLGMLGEHYLAAARGLPEMRQELLARARAVLVTSASTYAVALGPQAARSREARERAEALDMRATMLSDATAPQDLAPPTTPFAASAGEEHSPRRVASVVVPRPQRSSSPPAQGPPPSAAIGADASPSREAADPELRQLASDLARLRGQAERVTDDPAGLQRRAQRAERQRSQCEDAACLRAWYARRRQELLAEF